jgi:uncharacterized phage protein gp47/JayE
MASPDTTPYVDLTLFDKDPQDIFDAAIALLQIRLADWVPREANTEVLLLEALAQEVAELIFAANRIPDAVVETLLRLYGIERDAGAPPTVTLEFTMSGTVGYTVPIGTAVRLDLAGYESIVFTTDVELTILAGVSTGTVTATGDRYTAEGNGVPAGTEVELLDSLTNVDQVDTFTEVTGGRDAEEDADYFERGSQRFARLTETLVLPAHFVSSALDAYNPAGDPDNNGPIGADGGHMTVAVYGDGAVVSAPNKTALETKMEEAAIASLDVHIIDPTITAVNVDVTVKALAGYDSAVVDANVVAALTAYLDPMQWGWGAVVRLYELVQVINSAEGVDYIVSFTTPVADTNLTGVAPLADLGTVAVTVT